MGLESRRIAAEIARITELRPNGTRIHWPSKPHSNETPGHWETVKGIVEEMADSGDYSEIWVIKGLRNVSPGISPNWRPDVFGKRKSDGKIDGYEVPSKSQTDNEILDKLEDIKKELGDLAGKCKLKNIPSKHSGKPIPKDL